MRGQTQNKKREWKDIGMENNSYANPEEIVKNFDSA